MRKMGTLRVSAPKKDYTGKFMKKESKRLNMMSNLKVGYTPKVNHGKKRIANNGLRLGF